MGQHKHNPTAIAAKNGDFLACSDETDVDELLEKAYVEVRDDGPT